MFTYLQTALPRCGVSGNILQRGVSGITTDSIVLHC
jgi:hypothetical protein